MLFRPSARHGVVTDMSTIAITWRNPMLTRGQDFVLLLTGGCFSVWSPRACRSVGPEQLITVCVSPVTSDFSHWI